MICWLVRKQKRVLLGNKYTIICFFFLSNSLVAKHKVRTKLAPIPRNLDSHSQFRLAGQRNKHDVCYICLEKHPVGKCSASLQYSASAPFTETHCAQSLCFYWILRFNWWKPFPHIWKAKINITQIIKLLFNCILQRIGTVCSIHPIHFFYWNEKLLWLPLFILNLLVLLFRHYSY